MKRNKVFLSYRRDDSPGYVSRLEGELERAFGEGRIFRDANDIRGGTKWKQAIEENLSQSAVLLLIIGPRWESIWEARKNDEVNYVALELERARELRVPVIPISLDGITLSKQIDLGKVSWILDNQFHDLSDRQGRWESDFGRLVRLIESVEGMGAARSANTQTPASPSKRSGSTLFKVVGVIVGLVVFAVIWAGLSEPDRVSKRKDREDQSVEDARTKSVEEDAQTAVRNESSSGPGVRDAQPVFEVPDIGGTWQGQDGTYYYIQQHSDGSFDIQSPDYASGRGQFYTDRPRKFKIKMFGIGSGEFSVSASDNKIIGWIEVDGRQEYDTLIRVK